MKGIEQSPKKERLADQEGAALVVALLVMVICALLGATSILTSNTDMGIAANERTYHQALLNADAGIQWLRTQDLRDMSALTDMSGINQSLSSAGSARGIRFRIPRPPIFVWYDPRAGGAEVYRVRSEGADRSGRGLVAIEADIRVPVGRYRPVSEGYAGSD